MISKESAVNRLVLHHYYLRGYAFDLSDNRNHGVPQDVSIASAPNAPGFAFQTDASAVRVTPSATLANLGAVRAQVTFSLTSPVAKRHNLIEGHVSFALFVQPDGSLTATIFDRNGNWTGATTAPHLVSVNTWHTAEIQHDGINTVEIFLDGALVGSAYDALGPVASVGPHGIAIGHWPEVSGQYTFSGFIREVKLYKYDPYKDANGLLDHCCVDRKALDDAAVQLRRRGATADSLEAKGREILQFGYDMLAQVRGNDQAVTLKQRQISAQALSPSYSRHSRDLLAGVA